MRECRRGEIEQPGGNDTPAPPDLGDIGQIEIEAVGGGQLLAARILQDVETFGIGLHQAIFDAVVDHLYKMTGSDGTCMDVAALHTGVAIVAPRRAWNLD